MYIEERLELIEKSIEEIKNILLHRVVPIPPKEEVKQDAPKAEQMAEDAKPKKNGKEEKAKTGQTTSKPDSETLPKGHKQIIGLIDNTLQDEEGKMLAVKTAMVKKDDKLTKKWSFLIEDKRYGTFDESIANKIMECVDNRRMIKIEFTERKSDKGNIMNDIVKLQEATMEDVKP